MKDNIELMPCVCGLCGDGDYPQVNKLNGNYFVECPIVSCSCSTCKNKYATAEDAATAWNAMQRALQS